MRHVPLALGASIALLLAGCAQPGAGAPAAAGAERPIAVATTTQLGSVLADITACAGATSATLMGPGDDPHSFSVSSEQVATMVRAKLVVANGLGLEEGLASTLENVRADGGRVYEAAPDADPLSYAEIEAAHADEHGAGEEHGHEHGSHDPHFFMDVKRMAKAAANIGSALAEATGDQKYRGCGQDVGDRLAKVDAEVRDTLRAIPKERRVLVTDHEAYNYFAAAYDFEVAGIVIPGGSTDAEPSSAELAALVQVIRDEKVSAIFSNNTVSPRLVEAVARESGTQLKVVQLYEGSVGPEGSGAETYAGMMTTNARLVADALA